MGLFTKNKTALTKAEMAELEKRKQQAKEDNSKDWKKSKRDIGGVAYEMGPKGATGKIVWLTKDEMNTHKF
jgi:hypothetical protein